MSAMTSGVTWRLTASQLTGRQPKNQTGAEGSLTMKEGELRLCGSFARLSLPFGGRALAREPPRTKVTKAHTPSSQR